MYARIYVSNVCMHVYVCMYGCMAACMYVCTYTYVYPTWENIIGLKFWRITIEEANDGKEYFDEFDSRSSVASLHL